MAFQKLIFCVAFLLLAFVLSSLSLEIPCGQDEDCRNQLACLNDEYYGYDVFNTFCYEGRCYCQPWYSRCWEDNECPENADKACPDGYNDKCVKGTCVCSRVSSNCPPSPPPPIPVPAPSPPPPVPAEPARPLPSPSPSPADDGESFKDLPYY